MLYTLTVNGRRATVDVPADTPLLWVIRDVLDLKGTKLGSGIAQCGACTVHLSGDPIRSCTTLIFRRRHRPCDDHRGIVGGRHAPSTDGVD